MASYKTDKNLYDIVIGLEVHAQISTKSKLFSRSKTEFGAEPNSQVSLVDAAMPGMLPTLNKEAIKQAVKTGLALNSTINKTSIFDRKNYFYADLPQGYQISQFSDPLVTGGYIDIVNEDNQPKRINLTRIHVEQDAGKSIHDQSPDQSFIDLNRSGIALMEIVSDPDLSSSYEVTEFIKKLRNILRYVGSCSADMEKGNLRCDANISLKLHGSKELGTRCEIKNLNSIKNISLAIEYEIRSQAEILDNGGTIRQQTKLFNPTSMTTKVMRDKEDAHDYRYFPDPDLLPLVLTEEFIEIAKNEIGELPDAKKAKYISNYNMTDYDAEVVISDRNNTDYFEKIIGKCDPRLAVSWFTAELFGRLNKANTDITNSPVTAENLLGLIILIENNTISGKIAKDVLDKMFESGKSAQEIVKAEGLEQISDSTQIIRIIDKIISDNPDKVSEYKNGKDKLFGFFVGQMMKRTQGKGNPKLINELLLKLLSK
ncbi:MAG: Asp-tRNA(Asn)/Glu-tRNA(Gln) amidotransferase subunit GatB [Rickettsiales bacterium]|nr:Asp-tRNA(Asn)/Glu-tRNA(Gln) amidotransferase subunit GatB [Rickettsiales bacterium]